MKTIPVVVGFCSGMFLAGLIFQTLPTAHRKSVRIEPTGDMPLAKAASNHEILMQLPQTNVDATDYLTTAKRLGIFAKLLSKRERIMVLHSGRGDEHAVVYAREAAKRLDVGLLERRVKTVGGLDEVLTQAKSERVYGIFQIPDPLIGAHAELLFDEAKKYEIPTMTYDESFIYKGALVAYAISFRNPFLHERFKGEAISSTVRETAFGNRTPRYELILNLDTAGQINFAFPQKALVKADRIIAHEVDQEVSRENPST